MSLVEIKVEIPAAQVDVVDGVLLEHGVEGWSLLQDAIVQRAWIVGIFPGEPEARDRWGDLLPLLPATPLEGPALRALADQDWRDSYKAHFKAWRSGRLHWVPVWERATYALPAGDVAVWLDPGLAFGTGNHETTRLCCERLTEMADSGMRIAAWSVIDAGCGSGILALSAAKLGFGRVAAFDNDPEAVRVSRENAALNGLDGRVDFFAGDLVTGLAGRQAELVLANIQADVLMRYARELMAVVRPDGWLVLSGILAREQDAVHATFSALGPDWEVDGRVLGEWSDLRLLRPHPHGDSAS